MAKPREAAQRRHIREKGVIDHLADKLYEPSASIDEQPHHSPSTPTGQSVEGQVRKEWNPRKGGLPTFLGKADCTG